MCQVVFAIDARRDEVLQSSNVESTWRQDIPDLQEQLFKPGKRGKSTEDELGKKAREDFLSFDPESQRAT